MAPPGQAGAGSSSINPLNNMPSSLASAPPAPGLQLGTERVTSSIPMAPADSLPHHQQQGSGHWVYPSEHMFYNAMRRKVGGLPPNGSGATACRKGFGAMKSICFHKAMRREKVWGGKGMGDKGRG